MSDVGAVHEDVPFDYGVADALVRVATGAADALEGQAGSRSSAVAAGKSEFRGLFSELFTANARTAAADARDVVTCLRAIASGAAFLKEEARKEQERREVARAWLRERAERNGFQQFTDGVVETFTGGPDAPVGPAAAPGNPPVPEVNASPRQTPPPGNQGGSGVSSAIPGQLRSFATTSRGLNDELRGMPGQLREQLAAFAAACRWGTLQADGAAGAFERWLAANEQDVQWAVILADAFAAAGGEGEVSSLPDAALASALEARGVAASREDLQVDPPSTVGAPPTSGYANDPVNTATGNFLEPETDLGFSQAAAGLGFTRMYNSLQAGSETAGVCGFGPGWSAITGTRLLLDDTGARWVRPDGQHIVFPRHGEGWGRAIGGNFWLTREPAPHTRTEAPHPQDTDEAPAGTAAPGRGVLVVGDGRGGRWVFTEHGRWLSSDRGPGTSLTASYDQHGRLVGIRHERGRSITICWDTPTSTGTDTGTAGTADAGTGGASAAAAAGVPGVRVVAVEASDGRRVAFEYDQAGRLASATGPLGTRRYVWDAQGLLAQVVDAAGVVEAANEYDDAGRVISQESCFGRVTEFAYVPGRVTVTSSQDDAEQNTWLADAQGRVIGVIDARGQRTSMSYDPWGNLVSVLDREGQVTTHQYDAQGRRTRTLLPTGGEFQWAYDAQGRVVTVVTDTGSVTQYEYPDATGRDPSVVIDPAGGRTHLSWTDGLLQEVTDPAGVRVRFGYNAYGELVSSTNAAGDTARLEHDTAGRVTAAITPGGAVTRFRYDPAGRLVARQAADGGIWRYSYDPAGRVTTITDPLGARTTLAYDPRHGELTATTDPLGRVIQREFDAHGHLTRTVLPDGAVWGFAWDGLSRLRQLTDPAGGVWERAYTAEGALAGTIDPTGVTRSFHHTTGPAADSTPTAVTGLAADPTPAATSADTPGPAAGGHEVVAGVRAEAIGRSLRVQDAFASREVRYDRYGRPIASTDPAGASQLVSYDACGRPVELVDGEGGLTKLERDAAGRIIRLTSPAGRVTRFEYDPCGRPVARIDAAGGRTVLGYDADSRVIERHLPDGSIETFGYDACGRLIRHTRPGAGTARYGYDRCGRLISVQDAAYGQRWFRYDAAGQLVATVNGLGGVTRYAYDQRGRVVRITDPAGGVTTRTYTPLDKVASSTDPLGRTTRAGYDAAGRQLWQEDPDGQRTEWRFDASGRPHAILVNGTLQAEITRDLRANTVRITDHTTPDRQPVVHELAWNRRGQLTHRARNGQGLSWAYDPDGHRTERVGPDGTRTVYQHDQTGRLTSITQHTPGEQRDGEAARQPRVSARFTYDPAGRLTEAATDTGLHRWTYTDGSLTGHQHTTSDGLRETRIDRDPHGRITTLHTPTGTTSYGYDAAGQLTHSTHTPTSPDRPGTRSRWRYDQAGHLTHEHHTTTSSSNDSSGDTAAGGWVRSYRYDPAGQLTQTHDSRTGTTRFHYDGAGRRVRAEHPGDARTVYRWNPLGWTTGTHHTSSAGRSREQHVWTDVLGEPATITTSTSTTTATSTTTDSSGTDAGDATPSVVESWWDSAAAFPVLAQLGNEAILTGPGGILAVGDHWRTPVSGAGADTDSAVTQATGWRPVRATSPDDPWGTPSTPLPGHADGLGVTGAGSLALGGLEWLGARLYDPGTRSFTSTDPLPPVPGTTWAANPYAYAGNDPLHATDPTGLRPISDAELQAHQNAQQGLLGQAGDWLANNWEYLAAGAAIVAGVALMCTGVGGPAGVALMAASGALISGGVSAATQKAQHGGVDWGRVGVDAAIGGLAGGAGGAAGAAFSRGATALGLGKSAGNTAAIAGIRESVESGVEGAVEGAGQYLTGPGPHTPHDLLAATTQGAAASLIPGAGAAGRADLPTPTSKLGDQSPTPEHPMPIGPVPENAWTTLDRVDEKGAPFPNRRGGSSYRNDPRILPDVDANGAPITYREWDTDAKVPGEGRNASRVVTGSDGSAYHTRDHYHTFITIRKGKGI